MLVLLLVFFGLEYARLFLEVGYPDQLGVVSTMGRYTFYFEEIRPQLLS